MDAAEADFGGLGPKAGCKDLLLKAGLRPTRQRVILSKLLFAGGTRHVTAEMLFTEARAAGFPISLATAYNALKQFTQAGLLRQIPPNGVRSFFDTNTTPHPHYYLHGEDTLLDIPAADLLLASAPEALPGHEVSGVDLIIHLRRTPS
ncbi:Fur family transcriptional regulator Irr [Bradyrhizobium sp. BWA-3-5]|uniref:Fur family transcriptional regulator Irr n=1 Tax=Bradyrhizobium sp. BWA-3-5 TaxID=3080013 RepID=UPI00293E9426|nr:transcriptional repressor [Bradyrhizobium sp. BWA-3-5]WOH64087.1 transcriptional repressor [Bradyrhizobium sp. BWA-3-5]WOH64213.1 transcriptional repressor [Bradyrhizobium sp. BWA-3-5]WOH70136.1 transcriptional repressor [Bradyrhizobium sp. BWA-3-5]